ncbi:polysaccharide deacetylase family protein [Streptomyces sp. NPDC058794]|uniref:polysaccharide deacetylase family protein n=1 Tax=Streptomyces sp. NPDC058794 TaxID=3346636 RepID=UPI0036B7DB3B
MPARADSGTAPVDMTVAHAADQGAKGVHITFDEGPDSSSPRVRDLLRDFGAKATFC